MESLKKVAEILLFSWILLPILKMIIHWISPAKGSHGDSG